MSRAAGQGPCGLAGRAEAQMSRIGSALAPITDEAVSTECNGAGWRGCDQRAKILAQIASIPLCSLIFATSVELMKVSNVRAASG